MPTHFFTKLEFDLENHKFSYNYKNKPRGNESVNGGSFRFYASFPNAKTDYIDLGSDINAKVSNGETLVLCQIEETTTKKVERFIMTWLFYRPALDEVGVFVPERIDYFLEDLSEFKIPMLIQPGEGNEDKYWKTAMVSLDENDPFTEYHSDADNNVIPELKFNLKPKAPFPGINFGVGNYKVLAINSNSTDDQSQPSQLESTSVSLEIHPPISPLISVRFEASRYAFKPGTMINQPGKGNYMKLVIEPKNPTYSYIIMKSDKKGFFNFEERGFTSDKNQIIVVKKGSSGEANLELRSYYNPELKSTTVVSTADAIEHPITGLNLDEIVIPYKGLKYIKIEDYVEPKDATMPEFTFEGVDDPWIAYYYPGVHDFVGLNSGTTYVTVKAVDGFGFTKKIKVTVEEPVKRDGYDFKNGFFVMNEGWYNWNPCDINFYPYADNIEEREGEPYNLCYDQMNPGHILGVTGRSAKIWGDNLYFDHFGGSIHHEGAPETSLGPSVVNAETMLITDDYLDFDIIKGTGVDEVRVCNPYGSGVKIGETEIPNLKESSESTYEMIRAGKYIFWIVTDSRLIVVDPESYIHVKDIEIANLKNAVQTADGKIWCVASNAESGSFVCVNPLTLEVEKTVDVPDLIGLFETKPLWYRSNRFFAGYDRPVIFWTRAIGATGSLVYCWEAGDDPMVKTWGMGTEDYRSTPIYGASRMDPLTGDILNLCCFGWGEGAQFNQHTWMDSKTGKINKIVTLEPYYWFPCLPVFPDRFEPQITLESIETDENETIEVDLNEYLVDEDPHHFNFNIFPTLLDAGDSETAEVVLDDLHRVLTVTPKKAGTTSIQLKAMSNGKVVTKDIPVNINERTGVSGVTASGISVEAMRGGIRVRGLLPTDMVAVYDSMGKEIFSGRSLESELTMPLSSGIYVVKAGNARAAKVLVK